MVLSEEPRFTGTSPQATALERTFYTLVPSLAFAERCYDIAKFGEIPEELWVDCVVSSNADASLAPPGTHILTCFVQYVPYHLREGNWDEKRSLLGDRVVKKIAEYAPNVPGAIMARQVLTPLDLERTYGLTEATFFTATCDWSSFSLCARYQDGRNIGRPLMDSICAERVRIPVAA